MSKPCPHRLRPDKIHFGVEPAVNVARSQAEYVGIKFHGDQGRLPEIIETIVANARKR
mgnify:CR=1 FL=1